jgi:hypothetical protein
MTVAGDRHVFVSGGLSYAYTVWSEIQSAAIARHTRVDSGKPAPKCTTSGRGTESCPTARSENPTTTTRSSWRNLTTFWLPPVMMATRKSPSST